MPKIAKISEIFQSIQGEGIYQGVPQVFVRFYGCNLCCSFCDTKISHYEQKGIDEVMADVLSYDARCQVSLTGGEPLLQIEFLKDFVSALKQRGRTIYLETNGTLYRNLSVVIEHIDIIAMDFKLPSSGNNRLFWREHENFLKESLKKEVFVKAIVSPATHVSEILETVRIIKEISPAVCLVLQPQYPFEITLAEKLGSFLAVSQEHDINVRVIPQIHKQLGVR